MAQYITRIRTDQGDLQIDYNALANLPEAGTTVDKAVSDAIAKLNLPETYASKTHEHKIEDIAGLSDALSDVQDSITATQNSVMKRLVVAADLSNNTADYTSTQIIEHINKDGDVVLKTSNNGYVGLYGILSDTVWFSGVDVFTDRAVQYVYIIDSAGACTMTENTMNTGTGTGTGITEEQAAQIQANTEAIQDNTDAIQTNADIIACMNRTIIGGNIAKSDQTITMTFTLDDNSEEIHVITLDDNNRPIAINGVNFEWSGFDGT